MIFFAQEYSHMNFCPSENSSFLMVVSYELVTIERAWWNANFISYMSYEDTAYPRNDCITNLRWHFDGTISNNSISLWPNSHIPQAIDSKFIWRSNLLPTRKAPRDPRKNTSFLDLVIPTTFLFITSVLPLVHTY